MTTRRVDNALACAFCGARVSPEVHDGRPVIPVSWTLTDDSRACCDKPECVDHSRVRGKGATRS